MAAEGFDKGDRRGRPPYRDRTRPNARGQAAGFGTGEARTERVGYATAVTNTGFCDAFLAESVTVLMVAQAVTEAAGGVPRSGRPADAVTAGPQRGSAYATHSPR